MRWVTQLLVYVVLLCLLLPWASGPREKVHRAHPDNRIGRQPHRARLRRCRGNWPAHRPVRPCKNALLPPDDDDCERSRAHAKIALDGASAQERAKCSVCAPFGSRPLPSAVPRHQTLCILLI
jgi:hypothetical protein